MSDASAPANGLELLARQICDLADLIGLIQKSLPRSMAWQRKLVAELDDVDRAIQVLRMTVAMERRDSEILEAASAVHAACRQAELSMAGTRADAITRRSVRFAVQQSQGIAALLKHIGAKLAGE